jgi:long-chain acyl-CoA synthetase
MMAQELAQGMEELKLLQPMQYEGAQLRLVGLYAKNREEWLITDIACWMVSATNVPLYDTLGDESLAWVFEQTEMSTVFLGAAGIGKLLAMYKNKTIKSLKHLVSFDPVDSATASAIAEAGLQLLTFSDVMKKGHETKVDLHPASPDSLMTICYTSGTTARCKGVEITHRAFHDNARACLESGVFEELYNGMPMFSYLPLAHVFERVMTYISIIGGFKIGFYHGDMLKIVEDIAVVMPEVLVGVPRIYCRVYDNVLSGINKTTGFKRKLLNRAIEAKNAAFKKDRTITHWFYDRFILGKIRQALGGKVKLLVSAAAPLDTQIINTLMVLFSAKFIQGYGQTETAGAIALTYPDDPLPGSLGPPSMGCCAKVVDVPEMNYLATDQTEGVRTPRGELWVKGPIVSRRYFKDPENTKQTMDGEGWLHTGDIVVLWRDGQMKIIDRKKNIFKLQQGEYVAPEKIENVLLNSQWISQIFVYGDGLQTYVIAIIIPKKESVLAWAQQHGTQLSHW